MLFYYGVNISVTGNNGLPSIVPSSYQSTVPGIIYCAIKHTFEMGEMARDV